MINERQISFSLDDSALPGVPNHIFLQTMILFFTN